MEIWKDIKGYEGYYQVSNYGNVKSLGREISRTDGKAYTTKDKLLKGGFDRGGYHIVQLSLDGVKQMKTVHRLVAGAFLPNYHNHPEVNHIDTNPANNIVTNLEWCTRVHNIRHSLLKPVYQYDFETLELVNSWECGYDADKQEDKYYASSISRCCKGELETHAGCIWRWEPLSKEDKYDILQARQTSCREVYQYSEDLKLVRVWSCEHDIEQYSDYNLAAVRLAAHDTETIKTHQGYIFRFKEITPKEKAELLQERKARKIKQSRNATKRMLENHPNLKAVFDRSTGRIYNSVKEAAEVLGLNYNTLYAKVKRTTNDRFQFVAA